MKQYLYSSIFLFLALSAPALSQTSEVKQEIPSVVSLQIRTISAKEEGDLSKVSVDPGLEDLSKKFESLPYTVYSMNSSQQVDVPVNTRQLVELPDGQKLTLRLLYKNDKKLGIWLEWKDAKDMQLLNSKIHLHCREAVIAGTDNVDGSAMLIAVAAGQ